MDLSPLFQPLVDVAGVTGLWLSIKRDQRRTRAMVYAIAKHLGLRLEDGIHVETRTPARGQPVVSQPTQNGDSMRRIIPLLVAAVSLALIAGGVASADNGENAALAAQGAAQAAQGAAAASAGGPLAMAVAAIASSLGTWLALLMHQASTHWKLGALQQQVSTLQQSAQGPKP